MQIAAAGNMLYHLMVTTEQTKCSYLEVTSMRRVIAILTDFGTGDWYLGAMKGVIARINPEVLMVDITHEIAPCSIAEASFALKASYRVFPDNTVFLVVVDPGVGGERRAVALRAGRWFFVGPDNGVFGLVLESETPPTCVSLRVEKTAESATFHGRDVFAPAAAKLSRGMKLDELGTPCTNLVRSAFPKPHVLTETELLGEIVHVDRFGDLITNVSAETIPKTEGAPDVLVMTFPRKNMSISRVARRYSELAGTEAGTLIGSSGYLEVAVFHDSAARCFGIQRGEPFHLTLRPVRRATK
ncbi:MAG: SAM-dependent chlorinase/fluorinase [Candidatus Eisenbacteria bacterium]